MAMFFDWSHAAPEDEGFSTERLEAMRERLAARHTTGLLVARHDRIACEWYAPGWHAGRPHYTASLAKAIVGGVSLILALGDRRLGPDDRAAEYVPQWQDDLSRAKITVRHLATHSSGLQDANQEGVPHDRLPGWMGQFWKRDPDPFTVSRDLTPVIFPPGTGYAYSNPGMAMLAYCVTAALRGTSHPDLRTLLRERVFHPIALQEDEWSIGYGTTYDVDGLPLVANWGGGSFTARAIARAGRLMMRRGDWDGTQVLDPYWVATALTYAGTPVPSRTATEPVPASGLCWYTNEDGVWPDVPRDAIAGAGAGHQVLFVVPSLDLIAVRQGEHLEGAHDAGFWGPLYRHLFAPLVGSLLDRS